MLCAPVRREVTCSPEGSGSYKYRNLTGTTLMLPAWEGHRQKILVIGKGETFYGTDAFMSWYNRGDLSLFMEDGTELSLLQPQPKITYSEVSTVCWVVLSLVVDVAVVLLFLFGLAAVLHLLGLL